ncbi:MAG: hypothetical protein PHO02_06700 [Candidatus Nanoarchaeia archaeon]|nr:hypothetical protein [Candidatus Nanoarchaeia archaeon]
MSENLVEKIRKIAHKMGFTKDVEFRESGAMCDEAVASKKEWFPGAAFLEPTYLITFKANKEEMEMVVPEKTYDSITEGNRVALSYARVYRQSYDYVPPYFDQKELIETKCVDFEFIEAELLENKAE